MKRLSFFAASIAIAWLGFSATAQAVPIPIAGYDINDAVMSGHGAWAHAYTGTIIPGSAFINNVIYPGQTATYTGGGSGTLNDGVIGATELNTQLFVTPSATDGTVIDPTIFLTLSYAATIDQIDLFGGDFSNGIPGSITGVTVTLLKTDFTQVSQSFLTTPFGTQYLAQQVNDGVSLIGSSLEGIPAFAVFLSAFVGTNGNWFSLTEITLDGNLAAAAVPLPAALPLLLSGIAALGFFARRRGRLPA